MGKKAVSNRIKEQIIVLYHTGQFSNREIANQLGVSPGCVDKTIRKLRETETSRDRPRSGRPKKRNAAVSRYFKRAIKKCRETRRQFLRAIASQYSSSTGSSISYETVRRSFHSYNIHNYAATRRPTLKATHREARLAWCKERANLDEATWDTAI